MLTIFAMFFWNTSAEEIMKRVAENQDQAQNERINYLYDQHVKVDVRYKNGKLGAEEVSDYTWLDFFAIMVSIMTQKTASKKTSFHSPPRRKRTFALS